MRPIAVGLFFDEDEPRLIGGRHRATGRMVFPMPCGSSGEQYERIALSREGRLWSYTVQRFRPKSPPYAGRQHFEPYAVGYVELPGEIIIEARISDVPFDQLCLGMPLSLVREPFLIEAGGTSVFTYAFGPTKGASQ